MYLINIIDTTGEPDIITQIIDGTYTKKNNAMKITFKDYATGKMVQTTITKGEYIEYQGNTWQVANVAKTMCRLTPHGHNELPMWIYYERLFN